MSLICAVTGAFMVIFLGQKQTDNKQDEESEQSQVNRVNSSNALIAYTLLFSLPVLKALGLIFQSA